MQSTAVKKVVLILVLLVLGYAAFIIVSDYQRNLETLRRFPWRHLPLILGSVLVNFLLRWVKWEWYRRAGGIRATPMGSFLIFFSGYSMAISPARAGEVIKPYMYKVYYDQKIRRTLPLVFCERLSDLLGMLVLAVATAAAYLGAAQLHGHQGNFTSVALGGFLAFSVVFMASLVVFTRSRHWVYGTLFGSTRGLRRRYPAVRRLVRKASHLYFSTYPLLTLRNLAATTVLAATSWFFECLALWIILHGVGATHVTLAHSTFMFCMATIIGGFLFFLPGGIGGFEGSMAQMLMLLGTPKSQFTPAIVIIRFCTLFFSVALGFLFVAITGAYFHKAVSLDAALHAEELIEEEAGEDEAGAPAPRA